MQKMYEALEDEERTEKEEDGQYTHMLLLKNLQENPLNKLEGTKISQAKQPHSEYQDEGRFAQNRTMMTEQDPLEKRLAPMFRS